jgi:hypothetical protein
MAWQGTGDFIRIESTPAVATPGRQGGNRKAHGRGAAPRIPRFGKEPHREKKCQLAEGAVLDMAVKDRAV